MFEGSGSKVRLIEMRYAVRKTPRGPNLYPAAGAVGREAPEGTTEMVTLLWKSGEGAGEPSDGRR